MTEKSELIKALEEMAILLELKGVNPFKTRAFSNASRILQGYSGDFNALIDEGNFSTIKGIGKGIESFLLEIIKSGNSSELLEMKQEIPAGVLDLLRIPGLGPKKAKILWEKLNIRNIGELEYACLENRLLFSLTLSCSQAWPVSMIVLDEISQLPVRVGADIYDIPPTPSSVKKRW